MSKRNLFGFVLAAALCTTAIAVQALPVGVAVRVRQGADCFHIRGAPPCMGSFWLRRMHTEISGPLMYPTTTCKAKLIYISSHCFKLADFLLGLNLLGHYRPVTHVSKCSYQIRAPLRRPVRPSEHITPARPRRLGALPAGGEIPII